MGFDNNDRLTLGKLMITPESNLMILRLNNGLKMHLISLQLTSGICGKQLLPFKNGQVFLN